MSIVVILKAARLSVSDTVSEIAMSFYSGACMKVCTIIV